MSESITLLDQKTGDQKILTKRGNKNQMSTKRIQENLRTRVPKALEEIDKILDRGHPNLKVSIIKMIFDKVVPSMKTSELTGKDGENIAGLIIIKEKDRDKTYS